MKFDFFTIWFMVSPFIILHLYLKNKDYKNKTSGVIEQINDVWDNDYKRVIQAYGTIQNFLECHEQDYDIIRSNIVKMYEQVSHINRDFMQKIEKLMQYLETHPDTNTSEMIESIKIIRRSVCEATDECLTQINAFIINENEAHKDNEMVIDILNAIDEKYKNNNIYREVNDED